MLEEFLLPVEKLELENIETVYYFDIKIRQRQLFKRPSGSDNYGFDNSENEYIFINAGEHIMFRYEILRVLG